MKAASIIPFFIAVIAALIASRPAKAAEPQTWITAPLASYHWVNREKHDYNEFNYGVFMEYVTSEGHNLTVGSYRNSFYNTSALVFLGGRVWQSAERGVTLRVLTGAVSGYGDTEEERARFSPYVIPQLTVRGDRWGLMLTGIPGVIVGVGVSYRLQ